LLNGDATVLKKLFDNIPGLGETQKKLINDVINGKTESVVDSVKEFISDSDQIETARQQFLSNPSMLEALGIPLEVVQDKKAWAELMKEQMQALEDSLDSGIPKQRFSGSKAV